MKNFPEHEYPIGIQPPNVCDSQDSGSHELVQFLVSAKIASQRGKKSSEELTFVDPKPQLIHEVHGDHHLSPFAVVPLGAHLDHAKPSTRDHQLFRFIWAQLQYEFRQRVLLGVAQSSHHKRNRFHYYNDLREKSFSHIDHYINTLPPGVIKGVALRFRDMLIEIFDGFVSSDKDARSELERKLDETIAMSKPERIFDEKSIKQVGRGAFGRVYSAVFKTTGERVALKLVLPKNHSALARLYQEVFHLYELQEKDPVMSAYAAFRTPSAIPGIPDSKNRIVIVSEFVEGNTLSEEMKERQFDSFEEQLQWSLRTLANICDALSSIHDNDIYHRDLKPDNIKIDPQGQVRLLDFGLSKKKNSLDSSLQKRTSKSTHVEETLSMSSHHDQRSSCDTKSATKGAIGTPYYMSPENLPGSPFVAESESWAALLIFLESLSGRKVFEGFRKAPLMIFLGEINSGSPRMYPFISQKYSDILENSPPILKGLLFTGFQATPSQRLSPEKLSIASRLISLLNSNSTERPDILLEYASSRIRSGLLQECRGNTFSTMSKESVPLLMNMQDIVLNQSEGILSDPSLKKLFELSQILDELIIASLIQED